jgi:transcriptional regulator with XRE-family HTH domain
MSPSPSGSRTVLVDGDAIRAARESQTLSQDDLAGKAKVTKRTIEKLEKGGRGYRKTIRAVAEALGVEPHSLRLGEPNQGPSSATQVTSKIAVASENESDLRQLSARMNALLAEARAAGVAGVLLDLHREFSSREMHDALNAVWNDTADSFENDRQHADYRRRVLQFWEFIALLVRHERQTFEPPLRDRYRDHVSVWEPLKPIQVRHTAKNLAKKRPELKAADVTAWAEREVSTSNVEWLYNEWEPHRRSHFRKKS